MRVVIAEDSVLLREGLTKHVSPSVVEEDVSSIFAELDLAPTDTDHRRVLAALRFLRS